MRVCTGSLLLGAAGWLRDKPATTHSGAIDDLANYCHEVRSERVVDAGDIITSGGVTAAIDLGLHLVSRFAGEAARLRVAQQMEYRNDITVGSKRETSATPALNLVAAQVALIERFYHEMWNRFDKSVIPELLTTDIRFRGSLGQSKVGHEQFGEYVDFIRAAFPDFTNHIETVVSEPGTSFARLSYSGTHAGELFGVPATGKQVEYAGAALFQFRGGLIAEAWVLGDIHGLLRQIREAPDRD